MAWESSKSQYYIFDIGSGTSADLSTTGMRTSNAHYICDTVTVMLLPCVQSVLHVVCGLATLKDLYWLV